LRKNYRRQQDIKNKIYVILTVLCLDLSIKAQAASLYDFSFKNLYDENEILLSEYKGQFKSLAIGLEICKKCIVDFLYLNYEKIIKEDLNPEQEKVILRIISDYREFLNKPAEENEINDLLTLETVMHNFSREISDKLGVCFLESGFDPEIIYKNLKNTEGKVLLIVNVASKCQLASQLKDLKNLAEAYQHFGFVIIAVPSNSFGGLEFTDKKDLIQSYCMLNNFNFIVTEPVEIGGAKSHPFYKWVRERGQVGFNAPPKWNFHKYLFSREGKLVASFQHLTKPDDPVIKHWIQKEILK